MRQAAIKVDSQPSTMVVFWLASLCAQVTFRHAPVMKRHEKVTHHRMVCHASQQDPRDVASLHSTGRCRRQETGLSTSSMSRYPQSNGQAERAIGTVKNLMKKVLEDRGDAQLAFVGWPDTTN